MSSSYDYSLVDTQQYLEAHMTLSCQSRTCQSMRYKQAVGGLLPMHPLYGHSPSMSGSRKVLIVDDPLEGRLIRLTFMQMHSTVLDFDEHRFK